MDKTKIIDALYNAVLINRVHATTGAKREKAETALNKMLKSASVTNSVDSLYEMSFSEFIETNANEAMSTGQVGFGKEFVDQEILVAMLIERFGDENSILSMIPSSNIKRMNGKKETLPARGKKIRMVWGIENADIPAVVTAQLKKAKTTSLSIEAKKLILTVPYTDELLEDSVIEMGWYVISEISSAFDTSMHQVIINGDTTTGNLVNINIIDGNTTALPDGNVTDFIVINNGARKTAIINGSTVNAGAFELSDIRSARSKMWIKGLNPMNLVLVVSSSVYFKLLGLSQAETIEKFGWQATVVNGVITAIDGMRVLHREELGDATATGEVSANPALNTTGQAVIIHLPSLWIGIRRNFSTEAERNVKEQQTEVTGSARVDVVFNDLQVNEQATSSCVLLFNITI